MKNFRIIINKRLDKLDERWRGLPVKKQRRYTLLLFTGYALLSIIVLFKVCYDVIKNDNRMNIEHIENPVIKQKKSAVPLEDSIPIILKK